ncbi:DUF4296 domain-containing protein [Algibacter mikhailovii]|uniref:DUF4296 domain-containing protein n=1 Tax=Algibacter mikhailovii TaxID=425498 RepID=UPI002494E519|nr:DUF4296 domain-containing protein [Algibacter mikhailovii]
MILRQTILFFFILITISSCNRFRGPDKPENLISKDKMAAILIDSKFLTSGNNTTRKAIRDSNVNVKTYVYLKHNIDSLQFAMSNSYYAFHLDEYEEIYNLAIDSLERLNIKLKEVQAEEWKEQTKREEDSLKLVNKKKDSLNLISSKDSLGLISNVDSMGVKQLNLNYEKKNSLINPVSDTLDLQQ